MSTPTDFTERDRLDWIFYGQKISIQRFIKIEMKNGRLDDNHPVDHNSYRGQIVLKDFLWRVTEELVEVVQETRHRGIIHHPAIIEELSDALHFMTELCMLSDIQPHNIIDNPNHHDKLDEITIFADVPISIELGAYHIIHLLGQAGNELKARLWKRTHKETNKPYFDGFICEAYVSLIGLFKLCGCRSDDILKAYFEKHEINKKRAENNA